MPKKNNSKKRTANEKRTVEKKDILKELAIKLKTLENPGKETDKKKAKLEEDIELNINDFEFHDFAVPSTRDSAPVLEKIAGSFPHPIFVGGISNSSNGTAGEEKESDSFKYISGQDTNDKPKYVDSDSHIKTDAENIDFNRLGRNEFQPEINQEAMFMQSPEAKFESQFQEKVWVAERFDSEKEKRKNQFWQEETKNDKYKPDLLKSR